MLLLDVIEIMPVALSQVKGFATFHLVFSLQGISMSLSVIRIWVTFRFFDLCRTQLNQAKEVTIEDLSDFPNDKGTTTVAETSLPEDVDYASALQPYSESLRQRPSRA